MISLVRGNLFDSRAEALVNTVNCVGVMGKGIAHQFQRAFPGMYKDYANACRRGVVRLGAVTTFRENGKVIVNFPTKDHWKERSRLADVELGLRSLKCVIEAESLRSLALPPLGCGNGGLAWPEVHELIVRELGALALVEIELYEPVGSFASRVEREPSLSLSHYVLAALGVSVRQGRVTLQKAAYFFNVLAGEQYFHFSRGPYGPYLVAMDPMLRQLADYRDYAKVAHEDLLLDGLNRKLRGADADRLRGWLPIIERTADLVRRSAHEVEAMATVHAVVAGSHWLTEDELVERFYGWSETKAARFDRERILGAAALLVSAGLLARGLYGYELPHGMRTTTPEDAR